MFQSFRRKPDTSFLDFAVKRFRRIYFPFLGWCVIYLIASDLKRQFVTHAEPVSLSWSVFLVGTSLQHWFLPFLLIVSLLLFPLCKFLAHRRTSMRRMTVRTIGAALAAVGLVIALARFPWNEAGNSDQAVGEFYWFAVLSWQALPALFWGLAIAVFDAPRGMARHICGVIGGIVLIVSTAVVLMHGRNLLLENLAGIGAMFVAILPWDSVVIRRLAVWGGGAYGIYLAHALFVEAFFAIVAKAHLQDSSISRLGQFIATLVLSIATVWILNRSKWTRWLNG
jgi:peptidoglycan/LPS O-acetylase OafA/YrhL